MDQFVQVSAQILLSNLHPNHYSAFTPRQLDHFRKSLHQVRFQQDCLILLAFYPSSGYTQAL